MPEMRPPTVHQSGSVAVGLTLQHQLALPGSVASISDAFQRTLSIFTILFAPQYVLRTVFRRSFRISDAVG